MAFFSALKRRRSAEKSCSVIIKILFSSSTGAVEGSRLALFYRFLFVFLSV
jgi:hypothetical protein